MTATPGFIKPIAIRLGKQRRDIIRLQLPTSPRESKLTFIFTLLLCQCTFGNSILNGSLSSNNTSPFRIPEKGREGNSRKHTKNGDHNYHFQEAEAIGTAGRTDQAPKKNPTPN